MQDDPTATQLLAGVAATLTDEVLPATSGAVAHQVRVAANLCSIIERELRLGPAAERRAGELLAELLGHPGPVDELAAELVERLDGTDPAFEARAHAALVEITAAKLAVAKPGYDDYDPGVELGR